REVLPSPLLYLSAFFEQHQDEYYDRLLAVSQNGDWKGWLQFFLRGVVAQSNHATEHAKRIIDQREYYRDKLQNNHASASVLRLLDFVFTRPYLNLQQISSSLNISFNTAQKAVAQLESENILKEITGQKRNRIYAARQLMNLLIENEPIYPAETSNPPSYPL
ncbi:MAG TPA: hypothetical protein VHD90_16295, partial [Phototrophicaceae bacterium]|nr:hypothetical protein [Phototrophicaceae bacterium]